MNLRPYQTESLYGGRGYPGIYPALAAHRSALLVLPTGTGKTVVFVHVVERLLAETRKPALILAHREELLLQAQNKILAATSIGPWAIGFEVGKSKAGQHHDVVIASVQSLVRRLDRYGRDDFGLIVVDEAHHAVSPTYQKVVDHFAGAKVLGVTATPQRLDGKGLGTVFETSAYVYELIDAVNDGWLVPPAVRLVLDGAINLDGVRTVAGDYNQGDLAAVMESRPAVALVAKGVLELSENRTAMVFAVSVEQAREVAEAINAAVPGRARAIDGTAASAERDGVLDWLRAVPGRVVCNCALYTEGVDVAEVACVAMAALTKSRSRYAQMVGRGTRLLGGSIEESRANGKSNLLVLDFAGATAASTKQVLAVDILSGSADAEVRARAIKRAARGAVSVQGVLEDVAAEIAAEQRQRALEQARYQVVSVADPYAILGVRPRAGRAGAVPPTEGQLEALARHKIPGAEQQLKALAAGKEPGGPIDRHQATELLKAIRERERRGLCSVRQAAVLARHGLRADVKRVVAARVMELLVQYQWKPPQKVLEELRQDPELAPKRPA